MSCSVAWSCPPRCLLAILRMIIRWQSDGTGCSSDPKEAAAYEFVAPFERYTSRINGALSPGEQYRQGVRLLRLTCRAADVRHGGRCRRSPAPCWRPPISPGCARPHGGGMSNADGSLWLISRAAISSAKPPSPKSSSQRTLRWGEMDSNFWYRGTKAVDFRSIPGIWAYRRGS